MIWLLSAVIIIFIMFLLYSCVLAGSRADRRMSEIMRKRDAERNSEESAPR